MYTVKVNTLRLSQMPPAGRKWNFFHTVFPLANVVVFHHMIRLYFAHNKKLSKVNIEIK